MAVLNITPDSFSDGGQLFDGGVKIDAVIDQAARFIEAGAHILDVGGESTRPGADPVPEHLELERVVPVIEALSNRFECILSVDTSTPEVMRQSAEQGAHCINDVRALTRDDALEVAASTGLPVCLMHMQGTPQTMQNAPTYDDPVRAVLDWLMQRVAACLQAGFEHDQVALDPGFGFGKTLAHNLAIFQNLGAFVDTGHPVMVGVSRKTMIGELTGQPVEQRAVGSAVAAALAVQSGVQVVRVHDVEATRDALAVWQGISQGMQ
jgi:dihydropteroate synthase